MDTPQRDPAAIIIRPSADSDIDAMLAIYQHHIARGVTPEEAHDSEPPSADELKQRRKTMRKHALPHLVAERDGVVAGYAYAVMFRKRPAYRYTLKHSIYIHHEHLGLGIGRRLLDALVDACAAAGYRQMIGYIDAANTASLALHERCGFQRVGFIPAIGFKFGHWTDVVMVQLPLGEGSSSLPGPPR